MKRYLNVARVRRNTRGGRLLVYAGLAMLAGGFLYSLAWRDQVTPVLVLALGGTLAAQLGLALLRRWGRRPRTDERVDESLKGLDDRWATMHYSGNAPHLLFGPPGMLVLLPQEHEGTITLEDGQWVLDAPSRGLFRRGGRRRLDELVKQTTRAKRAAQAFLDTHLAGDDPLDAQPVLLFLSDDAEVRIDPSEAPTAAVHYKKIKDWLRRQPKGSSASPAQVEALAEGLGLEVPTEH